MNDGLSTPVDANSALYFESHFESSLQHDVCGFHTVWGSFLNAGRARAKPGMK